MRTSHYLLATLKETPADAETISHQLMLRAGMIRKLASGLYTWLPLGLKVLRKVEKIVREEMDRSGAIELLMPAVQPAELWEETNRWDKFGSELLKIKDRNDRNFCFGPTHEEVITDLMRRELHSYKQLPVNFYQIQNKFRDEIRPRFGVMRAREFLMKDAYSFHLDHESLKKTYEVMHQTYSNIFTRLQLNFRAVLADTGSIGGTGSHEFHVLAEAGEDQIFFSDKSDYAANVELAEALAPTAQRPTPTKAREIIDTPTQKSIADICAFLQIDSQQTVKTILVQGANDPLVALIVRGDHEINPTKVEKHPLIAAPLTLVSSGTIEETIGCEAGFVGPVGLNIPMIVDKSAAVVGDFVCGANQTGKHLRYVNWERDVALPEIADLRKVVVGDLSPDGQGTLHMARGIEVGHIFQLGTKYSAAMQATVLNEQGETVPMSMGCYGIGVSRIVAAAIEQNYDERGIIWPANMAPFHVALIGINSHKSEEVRSACNNMYEQLQAAGVEVLYDDRSERPGVMFADMELIGIPHRLVIGDRNLAQGLVEYRGRCDTESRDIALSEIVSFLKDKLYEKTR